MTQLVSRPDLSQRRGVSKSAISQLDICGQKAWYELRPEYRRPLVLNERLVFGSAVDAAVEQIAVSLRAGIPVDIGIALNAAAEVIERDQVAVSLDEVEVAAEKFMLIVAPRYDWSYARLQYAFDLIDPELGQLSGHPDFWLGDLIADGKTAKKAKSQDAAARSLELGFYALLAELIDEPIRRVAYWTFARTTKPDWQVLEAPVTREMVAQARSVALGYVRAANADAALNRKAETPVNWTFPNPPTAAWACDGCQYRDLPCPRQYVIEEGTDVSLVAA